MLGGMHPFQMPAFFPACSRGRTCSNPRKSLSAYPSVAHYILFLGACAALAGYTMALEEKEKKSKFFSQAAATSAAVPTPIGTAPPLPKGGAARSATSPQEMTRENITAPAAPAKASAAARLDGGMPGKSVRFAPPPQKQSSDGDVNAPKAKDTEKGCMDVADESDWEDFGEAIRQSLVTLKFEDERGRMKEGTSG